MSVSSHLTSLGSNLVLSESEKFSITTSISTLSLRLNSYFSSSLKEHFQFGSSTRGTILPRKADRNSDIDYMVLFDTSKEQMKPQTYLNRLRRFVDAKYSTSEIRQSYPTIVLSLNHINFELVPAIYNYGYQIPSPASDYFEWMNTNPSDINQSLQDKNKNNNYKIKPLVRLIKYWNASQGYIFTSFSLEQYIISQSFWGCSTLKDYFYNFWSGFDYSYDTPQYIKNKVDSAKKYAKKAKEYENKDMPIIAELEIQKIVPFL